jgi:hypothetical protein
VKAWVALCSSSWALASYLYTFVTFLDSLVLKPESSPLRAGQQNQGLKEAGLHACEFSFVCHPAGKMGQCLSVSSSAEGGAKEAGEPCAGHSREARKIAAKVRGDAHAAC